MNFRKAASSLFILASLGSIASATDTLNIYGLSSLSSGDFTATITKPGPLVDNVYAGPFEVSFDAGSTFRVFCADVSDTARFNVATPVTAVNTLSLGSNFQYAAQLYNAFDSSVGNDSLKNAGLQVAIWTALFPANTYTDYQQAGVIAQAQIYLSADVSGYSKQATYYDFGGTNQSQIGAYRPAPTPESGTIAALGFGSLALIGRRRKMRV